MARSTRFVANPGFAAQVTRENVDEMREAARAAQQIARSTAPVDDGDYRDGIEVIDEPDGATLVGRDWKSHWVEFGSRNNPASRNLTNAAMRVAADVDVK